MILSVILTKATPYIQVVYEHGVATISRLLQRTNLFCKRALSKRRFFAKETFNFKEPTNRSHPTSQQQCFVISSAEYRLFYRALLQKRPIRGQRNSMCMLVSRSVAASASVSMVVSIGLFCKI